VFDLFVAFNVQINVQFSHPKNELDHLRIGVDERLILVVNCHFAGFQYFKERQIG